MKLLILFLVGATYVGAAHIGNGPGICTSTEEVRYSTFDGAEIAYNKPLPCSYEIASSRDATGFDYFWVAVKTSKDRTSPGGATYTSLVHVSASFHTVSFHDQDRVFLDGAPVTKELKKNGLIVVGTRPITIGRIGRSVFVEKEGAFRVTYNGLAANNRHKVTVEVFDKHLYGGHMGGLCGNWNGVEQDDLIPEGADKPVSGDEVIDLFNDSTLKTFNGICF